ncbi:MAG: hypothetical protein VZR33_08105 [Methanosphaera sp.]|nr:hypothetical protein [Methanosphaera sp.]
MKFKYKYVLFMIFIILCSLSCVIAVDNNQSSSFDDNSYTTIITNDNNDYQKNSIIQEKESSNIASTSQKNYSIYSTDNTQEKEYYGVGNFGSNVMSVTIYEISNDKINPVFTKNEKSVTAEYTENNNLTKDGINKLISIVNDFNGIMNSYNVTQKYLFATASLRKIDNTNEVTDSVLNSTNLDIHLISGEEEAELGFEAVKYTDLTTDNGVLIDMGGGSTEVITFFNKTPSQVDSMPIGSLSTYKEYVNLEFPNETEIKNIKIRTQEELNKINFNNTFPFDDLYGNGGTLYTVRNVLTYLGDISNDTYVIPVSKLDSLLAKLLENSTKTSEIISAVDNSRINTLLPGIVMTKEISEYFKIQNIHFCKSKLDEGVIYRLMENKKDTEKENQSNSIIDYNDVVSNHDIPVTLNNAYAVINNMKINVTHTVNLLKDNEPQENNPANDSKNNINDESDAITVSDNGAFSLTENSYIPAAVLAVLSILIASVVIYRKR